MLKKKRCAEVIRHELYHIYRNLPLIIPAMIISGAIIVASWIFFGGPCRISVIFKIPGGGFTISMYYILWFLMFTTYGAESIIMLKSHPANIKNPSVYHFGAHFFLFLWYPLFFTTFSQLLSLIVILAGTVVLVYELIYTGGGFRIVRISILLKAIISAVYLYINFLFLIYN